MKEIIGSILIIISLILLALINREALNASLLKKIENNNGEIQIYNQVYKCKLKGQWKDVQQFIPAGME